METLITNPIRFAKEMLAGITKYALGKGVVTLGVMLATYLSGGVGAGAWAVAWPVVAGFMGWKMYRLYDGYTSYKDRMIETYRDEISKQLGIDPKEVTRDHLRQMAQGDAVMGIEPNPIIAEALNRQRSSALLSFCTATLSAAVTLTLLLTNTSTGWLAETVNKIFPGASEVIKKSSVAVISGLSGLFIHNGLDAIVGQAMGLNRATAHDKIALLVRQKEYGVKVAPQQVFDVFLAANPELARQVSQTYNKGITGFTNAEKLAAMKSIGIAESMQELADQINKGTLKPGALAFELGEARVAKTLQVKRGVATARSPSQQVEPQHEREAPAKRFSDRLAPRSETTSFVDAENQRREAHAHRLHHSI